MSAYNHVGQGHPSDVVTARTLGRVPDVPNPDELLIVNKTLVTIKLGSYDDSNDSKTTFFIKQQPSKGLDYNGRFTLSCSD